MNKIIFNAVLIGMAALSVPGLSAAPKVLKAVSPSGNIALTLSAGDSICYSVDRNGVPVVKSATIAMNLSDRTFGVNSKVKSVKRSKVSERLTPAVPLKHSEIDNSYNSMTVSFNGGYEVEFRVFDNGVAHRFITTGKQPRIEVDGERFSVAFPSDMKIHLQQPGGFKTAYEEVYSHKNMSEWGYDDRMSTLPVLVEASDSLCVLVSESDLSDYPCMFLRGNGANGFTSVFPKVPLEFGEDGDRSLKILKEADYIAETAGSRTFPWRYMTIGTPKEILEQTLTCQLASPSVIGEAGWVRPGFVCWEWWNGAIPYGDDVDFEAGCNLETYKYYIDFAARYGIPYILMDEGWAKSTRDPYTPNPNVDLHELVKYGKQKGVDIFLWLTWLTVERNFDLFKTFKDWGIAGVKIDFMDRSDQWMVNYYERVCAEAAKNGLMVDMHGSFKPAGLEHKYPNLLSYEGVRGMEQMGGCYPDNSLYLPFMRNAVGPMDYTPGAMISMQPDCYRADRPNSASIGTRAYQMALFVVFESGVQMLADNPTLYYRNADCTDFITSIPVTWDETRALEARPGEYVAVAKRKGDKWYIGAIANSQVCDRRMTLPLDFLADGVDYEMVSIEDGINANRQAMDYRRKTSTVSADTSLDVKLARSGGFAAILSPVEMTASAD